MYFWLYIIEEFRYSSNLLSSIPIFIFIYISISIFILFTIIAHFQESINLSIFLLSESNIGCDFAVVREFCRQFVISRTRGERTTSSFVCECRSIFVSDYTSCCFPHLIYLLFFSVLPHRWCFC
jgi:hypothetical protein